MSCISQIKRFFLLGRLLSCFNACRALDGNPQATAFQNFFVPDRLLSLTLDSSQPATTFKRFIVVGRMASYSMPSRTAIDLTHPVALLREDDCCHAECCRPHDITRSVSVVTAMDLQPSFSEYDEMKVALIIQVSFERWKKLLLSLFAAPGTISIHSKQEIVPLSKIPQEFPFLSVSKMRHFT